MALGCVANTSQRDVALAAEENESDKIDTEKIRWDLGCCEGWPRRSCRVHGGKSTWAPIPWETNITDGWRKEEKEKVSTATLDQSRTACINERNMWTDGLLDSQNADVEKRCVRYVNGEYDPKTVPPEWWSWLSMSRREPPTEELMAGIERMRESTKAKAEALKLDELRRRAERDSSHPQDNEQGMEQGLDSLLQDLGHKGNIGPGSKAEEENEDLAWKPEAWKP